MTFTLGRPGCELTDYVHGKKPTIPQRIWYVTLTIIDGAEGFAAILEDQAAKGLTLGRAEEVSKAFGDAVSLQVAKLLVEFKLFPKGVDGTGSGP